MNYRSIFSIFFILTMAPMPALAENLDQSIKRCISDELSDEARYSLLVTISDTKIVFSKFVEDNIASCFTKITGQPSQFQVGAGIVTTAKGMEEISKAKDLLASGEKILSREAQIARQTRQNMKCELLKEKEDLLNEMDAASSVISESNNLPQLRIIETKLATIQVCEKSYDADKISTLLNPVCNSIFSEFGLPDSKVEGPRPNEFADANLKMSQAQFRIIEIDMIIGSIKKDEVYAKMNSEVELIKIKKALSNKKDEKTISKNRKEESVFDIEGCS